MAKEQPPSAPALQPPKLAKLPSHYKIEKRPLLHPAIAAPRTGASTPKIVYVSASSPFISVVKRVRKLLFHIEQRESGEFDLYANSGRGRFKAPPKNSNITPKRKGEGGKGEEVIVKATGKAIEKCLSVAVYLMGQEDLSVRIRTASVGAVDDIIRRDGKAGEVVEGEEEGEEGSRVRRTSCLEVRVRLR